MYVPILLVAAIAFGLMAWFVEEPTVKKVSAVLFVICAVVFVVLVLLSVLPPMTARW